MGPLEHSPADILRYIIIAHGLGFLSSGIDNPVDWTVYADIEPDAPDNCITVYNTIGRRHKRLQATGRIHEHHGIQIRIRSRTPALGYNKARDIAVTLDEDVYKEQVTIGTSVYCLHSFSRAGDIIPFPRDTITPTKRIIHTFNGLVDIRQQVIGTGTIS